MIVGPTIAFAAPSLTVLAERYKLPMSCRYLEHGYYAITELRPSFTLYQCLCNGWLWKKIGLTPLVFRLVRAGAYTEWLCARGGHMP